MKRGFRSDSIREAIAADATAVGSLRAYDTEMHERPTENPKNPTPKTIDTQHTNPPIHPPQSDTQRGSHPGIPSEQIIPPGESQSGSSCGIKTTPIIPTTEWPQPHGVSTPGGHRSQGIHVYGSDDDIVDRLERTVRAYRRIIGIRQKTGYSLFVRAGLRALNETLEKDPERFRALLAQALQERQ